MKQNQLSTITIKKIKASPKSSAIKSTTKKIITRPKTSNTPDLINTITQMMSDCSLAEPGSLAEPHYMVVPVFLDINNIMTNYHKNMTEGGIHNLYLLVTKIFISQSKPLPTVNIFPGS